MASSFQQQALQRKVIYLVLIVALFTIAGVFRSWVVEAKAEQLHLREQDVGEVELGGSALRLSLTGMRGFVVCFLWNEAMDAQKKNKWNELDLITRSLTKLQPHFITPWRFQSWNLSYNVSVESDQVKDKYYYIAQGVKLLAEGERQNRNQPDIRFDLGFFQQHKMMQSDETNVFRCLWQMSCMPWPERDPDRFYSDSSGRPVFDANGQPILNEERFQDFCDKHPQMVRRLREKLRCERPEDVVQFLRENQKIPTIYEDDPKIIAQAERQNTPVPPRKDVDRFPVLPKSQKDPNELTWDSLDQMDDSFDAYTAARAWFTYSCETLPEWDPERPGRSKPITDRVKQRHPKMTTAIFSHYPARAQSYIAERLQQEGWFDRDGWLITDWFKEPVRVGNSHNWGNEFWNKAHDSWKAHGEQLGLYLTPQEEENKRRLAEDYLEPFRLAVGKQPPGVPPAENDPKHDGYYAALYLYWYHYYRGLTNFPHFVHRSEVELQPETIQARKQFFEARRLVIDGKRDQALAIFEGKDGAPGALERWRDVLQKNKDFRTDEYVQEESYEYQMKYVKLLKSRHGTEYKEWLLRARLLEDCSGSAGALTWPMLVVSGVLLETPVLRNALPDPDIQPDARRRLDVAAADDGKPLIEENAKLRVMERLGLAKPKAPPSGSPDNQNLERPPTDFQPVPPRPGQ
jgi:hypothetical protein